METTYDLEDHVFRQVKENQNGEEEANKAHMLLSMAVHHWNVGRMKRIEVLQGLLQNQRRRQEQGRWILQRQQLRKNEIVAQSSSLIPYLVCNGRCHQN
jgi:hypothetical protein